MQLSPPATMTPKMAALTSRVAPRRQNSRKRPNTSGPSCTEDTASSQATAKAFSYDQDRSWCENSSLILLGLIENRSTKPRGNLAGHTLRTGPASFPSSQSPTIIRQGAVKRQHTTLEFRKHGLTGDRARLGRRSVVSTLSDVASLIGAD